MLKNIFLGLGFCLYYNTKNSHPYICGDGRLKKALQASKRGIHQEAPISSDSANYRAIEDSNLEQAVRLLEVPQFLR